MIYYVLGKKYWVSNDINYFKNTIHSVETSNERFPDDLSYQDLALLKFGPITSVDVQRSLSEYKNLPSDNFRSFNFDNM